MSNQTQDTRRFILRKVDGRTGQALPLFLRVRSNIQAYKINSAALWTPFPNRAAILNQQDALILGCVLSNRKCFTVVQEVSIRVETHVNLVESTVMQLSV